MCTNEVKDGREASKSLERISSIYMYSTYKLVLHVCMSLDPWERSLLGLKVLN